MGNRILERLVPARLRAAGGYTLIELIVVMTILSAVLTPLVGSFTSALRSEADSTRHEAAYQNARLAIQRMRLDIHCAGGTPAVDQNAYGGFTMTLTEGNSSASGWCPGVIPTGDASSGIQWCTVPHSGSTTRFTLYRFLGTDTSVCGGSSASTFQVDYVAVPPGGWPTNSHTTSTPTSWVGNIWPDSTTCGSGELPTVAVDINVALDPVTHPDERYELRDQMAIRNAGTRC
jgi:prepilin-type N-terminal cleavage/methylation domain-containing protein